MRIWKRLNKYVSCKNTINIESDIELDEQEKLIVQYGDEVYKINVPKGRIYKIKFQFEIEPYFKMDINQRFSERNVKDLLREI